MNIFSTIETKDFTCNPFDKIGKQWMLIAAENDRDVNAMTASWGGLGTIFGRAVAYIFVRDSRYTKEFIDNAETFSLSFFDVPEYRNMLTYMGTVSGRDEAKVTKSGLTIVHQDGVAFFDEAETAILCHKISCHHLGPEGILDPTIIPAHYADNDFHNLYIGEIIRILHRTE